MRVLVVVVAVAAAGGAILAAPGIRESKRERAAEDRREEAAARERRIRELRALQAPRGTVSDQAERPSASRAARLTSRRLLVRDLETAVAEDARGRPDARRILRADCAGLGQGESPDRDLSARRSRFACTAITSEVQPGASRGVVLGYPYRALVDFATGRLAWCRIAGHPGEGAFTRTSTVAIPAKCGG